MTACILRKTLFALLTMGFAATTLASDAVISLGGGLGTWRLMSDGAWRKLHPLVVEQVVAGHLDNNEIDDIVVSFGSALGTWRWMNNDIWRKLHPAPANQLAVGDLDGNGIDDVVISFASGVGTWIWMNNSDWKRLHTSTATQLAVGDLDGNGKDDLVVGFPFGIFRAMNNNSWEKLHGAVATQFAVGDLDGNGKDDLVVGFPFGIFRWMNNSSWQKLHGAVAKQLAIGDIDGSGRADVVISFPFGIWRWMNNSAWGRLNQTMATNLVVGDLDGDDRDDVVVSFSSGPTTGTWSWMNNLKWRQLHKNVANKVAVARLTGFMFPALFDAPLQVGDYWEYTCKELSYRVTYGGSRISLGSPSRKIAGINAFPVVQQSSTCEGTPWKYLAVYDHQLLGSKDGETLQTVFDARDGIWRGGGFFWETSADQIYTARRTSSLWDDRNIYLQRNPYLFPDRTAVEVYSYDGNSDCIRTPGGWVCSDDNYSINKSEYFGPGNRPVGYSYVYSTSGYLYYNYGGLQSTNAP